MRNHALWTILAGLSLFACVGCATTESGGVFRGQTPCATCQNGGYCNGGYCNGGCPDGTCYGGCPDGMCLDGMCGDDCNGGCFGGHGGCFGGHGCRLWGNHDKWAGSNVHHYYSSMVPQCGVGTAMPMMVQYPYYTTKGPDDFFYCGD